MKRLLLIFGLCFPLLASAGARERVEALLASEEPAGVVFEIITGKNDGLTWALALVRELTDRLHARFPGLQVAVVTHGREMFALRSSEAARFGKVHKLAANLREKEVEVHVCGTYAESRDITPEAFPEFIGVAPEGPAQIRSYRKLGWRVVVIGSGEKPEK